MGDELNEKVAQLLHENMKLQDELNHIKEHTLSVEDSYSTIYSTLAVKENQIRNLEQQLNFLGQAIREKNQIIDALEHNVEHSYEVNEKLSSQNLLLKEELVQEISKNKLIEELKTNEEELRSTLDRVKQENSRLVSELSVKCQEQLLCVCNEKDLLQKIKDLETEKAELMALRDALLVREKEDRLKASETLECFLRKSPEWSSSKSQLNLSGQDDHDPGTGKERNLREEILEAETEEKQMRILQLQNLLHKKMEEESQLKNLLKELEWELDKVGISKLYSGSGFRLELSSLNDIYNVLLRLINWPEGQSAECKPLTEVASLAVVIKDGVQTTQPGSIRVVETISIASQTDPIKNLSPVLQFKAFEKFNNSSQSRSLSDSDDEEQPLSPLEDSELQNGLHLFSDYKNCDLDMDMYRSCRKLSVLPEEENDESLNKKSSLKRHAAKNNSIKLKVHSADDVSNIRNSRPLIKETSSCMSVIASNCEDYGAATPVRSCDKNPDRKELPTRKIFKANGDAVINSELKLPIMSPKDALRQPHSFDSYLDPQVSQSPILARQISDPTQNAVFAPPITRRGSYIKKPRSTCRPLRLPCDKDDRRKEERTCKVRFNLSGIVPKNDDNMTENARLVPASILTNNENIRIVSRFRVEIIDEVEFRKSLEEDNTIVTRKRPPLVHSVVYKKSVFRDLTNFGGEYEVAFDDLPKLKTHSSESPDSPTYDTATEGSPAESIDVDSLGSNYQSNDVYPMKKRKHSDSSCHSVEDGQDSSEGNDILKKSIKLHTNSECIVMKDVGLESSDSSHSVDLEIPFIDAEDLPVIKPSPEIFKTNPPIAILTPADKPLNVLLTSPGSLSDNSDTFLTPCDVTPVSEGNDPSSFGLPKSSGLSKSPTVLKNLANFELLSTIAESSRKLGHGKISEEEEEEEEVEDQNEEKEDEKKEQDNGSLKRTSSDVSEASESDTLTYGTVKSNFLPSSDCDSDTYVTIWSDKSALERKFSDLSENSSSPYNTPPDTSSASFCTPPDTYSPILSLFKKYPSAISHRSSENHSFENKWENVADNPYSGFNSPSASPPMGYKYKSIQESSSSSNGKAEASSSTSETKPNPKCDVIFDSPKLEFYETNDSVENLEAFLQTEEGLADQGFKNENTEKPEILEGLTDSRSFDTDEFREALSKRNSLESPKLSERRGKRHPPLSRQNSTEDYNFLDPHDSCLNLSEEISSPSTTPDTSNKTVIFKNIPLTVSNTIDLEDEDFPISEAEIQVNFNGSQTEILEIPLTAEASLRKTKDDVHCRSEPCTPSISSPADFPEFSVLRKQRSSFTDESLMCTEFESGLPAPPEIIVSNLSSDSDNSDSEAPGCAGTDFASNVSDRSEVHLSDVNSISGHSDNCGSLSEHSDNVVSDVFSSDSDKSSGISPEISKNSSSPPTSDRLPSMENDAEDFPETEPPETSPPVASFEEDSLRSSDELCIDVPGGSSPSDAGLVFIPASLEATSDAMDEASPVTVETAGRTPAGITMSKPSDVSVSDTGKPGEDSGLKSSEGSDNSKDVNLNSINFADCNLVADAVQGNGEMKNNISDAISQVFDPKTGERKRRDSGQPENQTETETRTIPNDAKHNSAPITSSSTPKIVSNAPQTLCNLFPNITDSPIMEPEASNQTYLLAKSILNLTYPLTDEEIGKKFQDLSFAFKTDSLTIQKRLHLMKRRRDQAESNIENELEAIKNKLKSFQCLGLNSDYVNLMSDVKKQLDFVLNATMQLSSSAEGYGYTQHEEKSLELFTVMLQHVENVETMKNETSKILDKLKVEGKRHQSTVSLDNYRDEDRMLRRRSVSAIAMDGSSRRRASIATLPTIGCSTTESAGNGKTNQWLTSTRPYGGAVKKLSFSQSSTPRTPNTLPGMEESRRDSVTNRHRTDSRTSETSVKNTEGGRPEQMSSSIAESEPLEEVTDGNCSAEENESSLHLRQLYDSIEEIGLDSIAQESVNIIYCLRRIIELNKKLLSATRFRWPDEVLHYLPFYLTWYAMFVFALIFVGGLFTGINGCCTYLRSQYFPVWFAVLTSFVLVRRLYRLLLPLFLALLVALALLFLWLTQVVLPGLNNEEIDKLFRTFGFELEVRYPHGPPPV